MQPAERRLLFQRGMEHYSAFKMGEDIPRPAQWMARKLRIVFEPFRLVAGHRPLFLRIIRVIQPVGWSPIGINASLAQLH